MPKLNISEVKVELSNKKILKVEIEAESHSVPICIISKEEAQEYGESEFQLTEGCSYQYKIEDGYLLEDIPGILTRSKFEQNQGRLTTNVYVGTLQIFIYKENPVEQVGVLKLEVKSIKSSYRQDYRLMLSEITDKCSELLLQPNSPVVQNFTPSFAGEAKTLYQRFAFIKSVLESEELNEAIHKFLNSPITIWKEVEGNSAIQSAKKLTYKSIRQIVSSVNRQRLPSEHALNNHINSLPRRIIIGHKIETNDTPENRFIKYALTSFLYIISQIKAKGTSERLKREAGFLEQKLEQYLAHSVFREISFPKVMPLNSPVLQRKEGYREIFRTWLMFDLASKLIWGGGEDVYSGNKRDVAILYEYWLFFKLLDLIKEIFHLESTYVDELIEPTNDGLALKLRQGRFLPIKGVFKSNTRLLNIEFSYNKTFKGDSEYPNAGSWSRSLRPDYTLSIWPYGVDATRAEIEEAIVHIHFDAKYRIENLQILFASTELDEEKKEEIKGDYKRTDLLKMHTYRDAIRRTAGAYLLYPGDQSKTLKGFHELLPGLGAFCIRPSSTNDGITELRNFLVEIVNHFLNRTSQREKMSIKTYAIHKNKSSNELNEILPEAIGENRNFDADETFVLIGFYKNDEHLKWIVKNKLYNARTGTTRGSLRLSPKETGARYLLLHTFNETKTSKLFKLNGIGPRIFSKEEMIKKNYQSPGSLFYLVYDLQGAIEREYHGKLWDITKLPSYLSNRGSGIPFAVSISELMSSVVK